MVNNTLFNEVVNAFNKYEVEYIIIGGWAVNFHGHQRKTNDLDIWGNPTKANLEKVYDSLIFLGYDKQKIQEFKKERDVDDPRPIKLWDDKSLLRVDVMTYTYQNIFTWKACFEKSVKGSLGSVEVLFIDVDQLIEIKQNSSRIDDSLKDLTDAKRLQEIRAHKNNGKH